MNRFFRFAIGLFLTIVTVNSHASDTSSFVANYGQLEEWLFDVDGELFTVENFTYKKDVATFYFQEGTILLRRSVLGRPTVAIFLGKGNVSISVPSHSEKQTLLAVTKDSSVNEEIDYLYIRFADDFDLMLKKEFQWSQGSLTAQQARQAKAQKGDNYFKPIATLTTDNYFQLMKSAYNRKSDGYFWASFGKFVFNFDPDLDEQVRIYYARALTDFLPILVSKFQRIESFPSEEPKMSEILFSTKCLEQKSLLEMAGSDGYEIISARSEITVSSERDSTKFVSFFMDERLGVDSVFYKDSKLQFHKRKDLRHLGIILPEWIPRGDSFKVCVWYHGIDYSYPFPYVLSQTSYPHALTLEAPASYNYIFPCNQAVSKKQEGKIVYQIETRKKNSFPFFMAALTGLDTIKTATEWGMPVYFLMPSVGYNGPLERRNIRDTLILALEYMYATFGEPRNISELYVLSGYQYMTIPGVISISDYNLGSNEYGRFCHEVGRVIAGQWINDNLELSSYRENWMVNAFREYMSLLLVQSKLGNKPFYTNLDYARQTVLNTVEKEEDLPLSTGISGFYSAAKGTWLLHMLRNLYNKSDSLADRKFVTFLNEIVEQSYEKQISNKDFTSIAEGYFGYEMDWFFSKFLFGAGVPEYEVSFSSEQRGDEFFLKLRAITKNVEETFLMPILIRIDVAKEPTYHNQFIAAKIENYEFGPFSNSPTELYFNKFYSVLSKVKISSAK